MPIRIVLYQPDIPQNTGTLLRMAACLGLEVHVIEPAGFRLDDRAFRRAGMDYLRDVLAIRHDSWQAFGRWRAENGVRLILFTTKAADSFLSVGYRDGDALLFGRESQGVPDDVHAAADLRVTIPMQPGFRSLNVAVSAALAAGEALRQTGGFAPSGLDAPRNLL